MHVFELMYRSWRANSRERRIRRLFFRMSERNERRPRHPTREIQTIDQAHMYLSLRTTRRSSVLHPMFLFFSYSLPFSFARRIEIKKEEEKEEMCQNENHYICRSTRLSLLFCFYIDGRLKKAMIVTKARISSSLSVFFSCRYCWCLQSLLSFFVSGERENFDQS